MKAVAPGLARRLGTAALVTALMGVPIATGVVPPPIEPVPSTAFSPVPTYPPATDLPAIVDPAVERPEPSRPIVVVPTPRLRVTVAALPIPGAHGLVGKASYYCGNGSRCTRGYPAGGYYAAAGPKLRVALCGSTACTSYKGRTVFVDGIPVRLIDYCQCYWRQPNEKLIDLYYAVFRRTGSSVTITW